MNSQTHYLVFGGTGRQGGSVINALLDASTAVSPSQVYAVTRNTEGASAQRLAGRGINLIQGDLINSPSIMEELITRGVQLSKTVVYFAQAHGPTEVDEAKSLIDASVASGLQYIVYSSVDRGGKEASDRDASYCKTFSDKYLIEKYLEKMTKDTTVDYTIIRPTWFIDNASWGFPGRLSMTAWRDVMGGKKLQVTSTKDIGRWAAFAMLRPDEAALRNSALSIASDELTFDEMDDIFKQETGKNIEVMNGLVTRAIVWMTTDLRTMFGWIKERDYGADMGQLQQYIQPYTFRQWAADLQKGERV